MGKDKTKKSLKHRGFKNTLIPSNCSYLEIPYLNSEIYNKMHDPAINRDKGAQRKQKGVCQGHNFYQVVNLKKIDKKAKKELSMEILKLRNISPFLHQSIRMQNVLFMETLKKRKYEICSTLGKKFRCYSSCPSTEDNLFDEPTIKKIRQDLKHSVTYSQNKSYKGRHYKDKTYDKQPSQHQQSNNKRNNNQGYKQTI